MRDYHAGRRFRRVLTFSIFAARARLSLGQISSTSSGCAAIASKSILMPLHSRPDSSSLGKRPLPLLRMQASTSTRKIEVDLYPTEWYTLQCGIHRISIVHPTPETAGRRFVGRGLAGDAKRFGRNT